MASGRSTMVPVRSSPVQSSPVQSSPVQSSPVQSSTLQKQSVPTDGPTDNLSIFQGQSNIRTVTTVTHNQPTDQPTDQPREYRAFPIFQSIAGLEDCQSGVRQIDGLAQLVTDPPTLCKISFANPQLYITSVEKSPVLKRECPFKQEFWENCPFFARFSL